MVSIGRVALCTEPALGHPISNIHWVTLMLVSGTSIFIYVHCVSPTHLMCKVRLMTILLHCGQGLLALLPALTGKLGCSLVWWLIKSGLQWKISSQYLH